MKTLLANGLTNMNRKRGYKVEYCDASDDSQHVDIVIAKLTDEFGSFKEEKSQQVIQRFQVSTQTETLFFSK